MPYLEFIVFKEKYHIGQKIKCNVHQIIRIVGFVMDGNKKGLR
jgi:hypothetical protein